MNNYYAWCDNRSIQFQHVMLVSRRFKTPLINTGDLPLICFRMFLSSGKEVLPLSYVCL